MLLRTGLPFSEVINQLEPANLGWLTALKKNKSLWKNNFSYLVMSKSEKWVLLITFLLYFSRIKEGNLTYLYRLVLLIIIILWLLQFFLTELIVALYKSGALSIPWSQHK